MRLIAHRGNINGPNPGRENEPSYIQDALNSGYDCEIDLWIVDGKFILGHDAPQYETDISWLESWGFRLWIHCKDYETLRTMTQTPCKTQAPDLFNFFYHTDEDYVLTSQGYIWAYPGKPGTTKTVCVMPEWNDTPVDGYWGVCSDYVEKYRD